jgi:ABC-2 type transport system ATP-binding protein
MTQTMSKTATTFVAENVSKQYANKLALDNLSIKIPSNCIFGLLGPNGAGKTSFIRIINQITAPDSGKIFIKGEPLSPKHIGLIGYLPEERGLYKKMGVGEQAMYLAQLKGMSKKEAKEQLDIWFEKFEISSWWNKKVEELSKGMAQKVQFITTVLHNPKIIILDEPFSGFDPINTNLIKSEILRLKSQGATILLSTHNMNSVDEICDRIALLNNGKKILEGKVNEIKTQYSNNTYEITFKGNMLGFANALWGGFEIIEKEVLESDINKVTVKLAENITPNHLLKDLLDVCEIKGIKEVVPSMNDIFITSVNQSNSNYNG